MRRPLVLAALILAAGSGSRFDPDRPASKVLTDLEGQPLLGHVLGAVREYGPATTVVVLGHGAAEIEQRFDWSPTEIRARNHHPEMGLASSLHVGIRVLEAMPESFDGVFIVLGDQPRLRAETMTALRDAASRARPGAPRARPGAAGARPTDRPLVVPRYAGEAEAGPRNPVLLLRRAWSLVDDLQGDRGLASLIDEHPDMMLTVPVPGTMPDVDTTADLERVRRRFA